MKTLVYCFLFVLSIVLSLPTTSDAFSRRSKGPEVGPNQALTTPVRTATTENGSVSAQSVPEPPVLLLMTLGLGLFALGAGMKAVRMRS
jgi:hypothetical protein